MKFVRHAVCIDCGKTVAARPEITTCPACGGLLDIIYDYEAIKRSLSRRVLAARPEPTMWRYADLLPVETETAARMAAEGLRVGNSPLYPAPNLAAETGIRTLYIKDDGQNPTASLKDRASAMAVAKALEAPVKQIAANAGLDGSVILENIKTHAKEQSAYGFDAYNEVYCDMIEAGIVDPAKVTRSALQNAASVASMVLTTESVVADKPEPPAPAPAAPDMGGMGGMY